jgi:hypothetical protein
MNRLVKTALRLTLASAIFAAAMLPQTATAEKTVRYVKSSAESEGDGLSWDNASNDLQKMINASSAGDEVWVFAGTYKPKYTAAGWDGTSLSEGEAPRDRAFVLKAGVKIYGGFTSEAEAETAPAFGGTGRTGTSTLSGDIDGTSGLSKDDAYHVVIGADISAENPAVLDGFTVSGGNANASSNDPITVNGKDDIRRNSGGGIINSGSSPILTNLIVSGNEASSVGGGMHNRNSSAPELTGVTIEDNTAGYGGGMANSYSSPIMKDMTIRDNTASSAGGGGIYNAYSSPKLKNVVISKNTAALSGGGMHNGESFPELEDVIISDNIVKGESQDGYGGGIYNAGYSDSQKGGLTLSNVKIINNRVENGFGGGIANSTYSSSTLENVTISGNYASDNGGGIYNEKYSSSTLTDVIISGNSALVYGGGIYNNDNSYSSLTNVTISGNYAKLDGGGIGNNYNSSASDMKNTIVWGNGTEGDGTSIYNHVQGENSNTDNKYENSLAEGINLEGDNFDGTDDKNDPMFVSPVEPSVTPTTDGDYHLWKDSPLLSGNGEDDKSSLGAYADEPFYYGIDILCPKEGTHSFDEANYNYEEQGPLTVIIKNTGSKPTGTLSIELDDENANFAITDENDAAEGISKNADTKTFNVAPVQGLGIGKYSATVTVTINGEQDGNESKSKSFKVSFEVKELIPTAADLIFEPRDVVYNGKPQKVTVRFKNDLDTDISEKITIKYKKIETSSAEDGASSAAAPVDVSSDPAPSAVGEYEITVDIAAGENFNKADDLSLGMYEIKKIKPTAKDLAFNLGDVVYDGKEKPLAVKFNIDGTGFGDITVKYKGSENAPTVVGTYAVTVDIDEGGNNDKVTNLSLGDYKITRADPTAKHLAFDPSAVVYDGKPHSVTVKHATVIEGLGEITAIKYNGIIDAPIAAGTYAITVDIAEGDNYNKATSLPLGTYEIKKAVPTVDDLVIDSDNKVDYSGNPQPLEVNPAKDIKGLGKITVMYDGSTTAPTNAGTYDITVDIATGDNYTNNRSSVMSLGKYTINKIAPTEADIVSDLRAVVGNGSPQSVTVTPAPGIDGLGDITVLYDGDKTPPIDPGKYSVTVTIDEGDNYLATDGDPWELGDFIIYNPPTIQHRVTILPYSGLTTYPDAGSYNVVAGANFSFRIKLNAPSVTGTPPQVQTNRTGTDGYADYLITPESDGLSYTVVIFAINQNVEITLDTPVDNASVAANALTLGTVPGALVITNSRADAVTLQVYTPAGVPVRLTTVPPGTTRLTVPPGIYIVTDGGAFRRKTAVVR